MSTMAMRCFAPSSRHHGNVGGGVKRTTTTSSRRTLLLRNHGYVLRASSSSAEIEAEQQPTSGERTDRKVVVVTGGAKGIGAACCRLLATEGWAVVVNHREQSRDAAETLVAEIRAEGGEVRAHQADVTVESEIIDMFASVAEWGQLCGLVNNAGVLSGPNGTKSVADASAEDLAAVMATNVVGPMLCCREAVKYMSNKTAAGGGAGGGSIVNISSGSAVIGRPLLYAMSKGALNSFQAGAVDELATHGIRINAVSPGMTNTELVADVLPTFDFTKIPLGRVGEPEEIAEGVAFLLSDKASYVSGANLRMSGGRTPGNFIG